MDYCKNCDKIHIFGSCDINEKDKFNLIKNWRNANFTIGILAQASQFFIQNLNCGNINGCRDQLNILEKYKTIVNEDIIICYNNMRLYILEQVPYHKDNREELFKMVDILTSWINDIFFQRSQILAQPTPQPISQSSPAAS